MNYSLFLRHHYIFLLNCRHLSFVMLFVFHIYLYFLCLLRCVHMSGFAVRTVFERTRGWITRGPLQKPCPTEHRAQTKARGRARELQAQTTSLSRRTATTSSACSEATGQGKYSVHFEYCLMFWISIITKVYIHVLTSKFLIKPFSMIWWLFLVQGKYYNIVLPELLSEGVNRKLITYHGI